MVLKKVLIGVKFGDKRSFNALYGLFFDELVSYAYRRFPDVEIVEEIVQDVFVVLWNQRNIIDENSDISHFLYAVLKKKLLHALRGTINRAHMMERYTSAQAFNVNTEPGPEKDLELKELNEQLNHAINALSDQCKTAFYLSRIDQLKYSEIAEKMNISVKTVEKHIGKALYLLRGRFK